MSIETGAALQTRSGRDQHTFSPGLVALIIAIALVSFGALLTLLAWGPEIQSKDRAGAHPYSSSALGYAGLIHLLELRGETVSISRSPLTLDQHAGLLILTPGAAVTRLEDHTPLYGKTLIILPKWSGTARRGKPNWFEDTGLNGAYRAERMAQFLDADASASHIIPPNALKTPYGRFRPSFDEKLQILQSELLEPIIRAPTGILLGKMPDEEVYILADPDLANTFGLTNSDNARLMLSIIESIQADETIEPITFDAVLNGFERSGSLLKIILDIPFLGATLVFLFGCGLLGWAACIRFGAPDREAVVFALGKQALADNTAALFSMTHREARMAPGYLALTRKAVAKALGAPPSLSERELTALLDRLNQDEDGAESWTQITAGMDTPSANRDELLNKAQRLYRWRKETTHGH